MLLATPIARLWWPWKPISVSGFSASRTAAEPRLHVVGQHVAGRVGDVDAVGAVASISLACLTSPSGLFMCAIIRKPTVSMPSLRAADVLLGDIGLGAVGGHADRVHAQSVRHLQVVDRADAGQQQRRDLGLLHQRDHGDRYSSSVWPGSRS
jgi:hypothetical protein